MQNEKELKKERADSQETVANLEEKVCCLPASIHAFIYAFLLHTRIHACASRMPQACMHALQRVGLVDCTEENCHAYILRLPVFAAVITF